ncbi:MAG: hypothetical protein WDO14_20890 [Bacteroidota bacterium]
MTFEEAIAKKTEYADEVVEIDDEEYDFFVCPDKREDQLGYLD